PQQDFEWDESVANQDPAADVSDDVNGLALTLDNKSSYLGISSITAIIRVIVQIAPNAKTWILNGNAQSVNSYQECPRAINEALLPDEMLCINGYFTHVHNSNPLINEALFRSKHLSDPQNDSPWIALLNMVLTMGSIAVSDARNRTHFVFYRPANPHMTLESLSAGHLETVQAFEILGGSYLHYLSKPNLASVITGATLRMAVALGLHLEPARKSEDFSDDSHPQFETRRRTCWCLFCFDTWASATLGRPSLGRWDPCSITASLPTALDPEDFGAMCLRASVEFYKIGTGIQDRFARAPLISSREILEYDTQLLRWESQIPGQLRDSEATSPCLGAPCALMRSRYLNLRLVLCRPRLLISCLRQVNRTVQQPEERQVIDICREIAEATVQEVAKSWFKNQISAWNAVWLLFQATMIPLLGLFSDPDHENVPKWRQSIEKSLSLFGEMRDFSLAAQRSCEVVARIYAASEKARTASADAQREVQSEWTWLEDQFWPLQQDKDWFSFPEYGDVTFDMGFLAGAHDQGPH
ncbi:fungal-specific transcription factor domain-containing protein, partial [Hyaloscypha finlandica]